MFIQEIPEFENNSISPHHSRPITNPFELNMLRIRVFGQFFKILFNKTGNIFKAVGLLHKIKIKYHLIFGVPLLTKAVKVNDRYFWRLGAPGFPSEASIKLHKNEVARFFPNTRIGLNTLFIAITKKCPMKCEHCFEWNNLNKKDQLSKKDLIEIVHKYQDFGTTQIMFSGGEPMLRIKDIYEILAVAGNNTDFWIITSGIGLSIEHAQGLKSAGLTGVMVSLDHYEASKHDQFRGFKGAFDHAIQAIINAKQAGLATTLSLCAIRNFVSDDNINAYMNMAQDLGVTFVQIVEPRATGKYEEKDVELREEEILLLEKIYLKYMFLKEYKDFPIINYLGYHQRRVGCFGSGNRFFYVDADGNAQICPYCISKVGNVLDHSVIEILDLLEKKECQAFSQSNKL